MITDKLMKFRILIDRAIKYSKTFDQGIFFWNKESTINWNLINKYKIY